MKISKAGAWAGASVLAVASQAMGQQAVEWKIADGGNGHIYARIGQRLKWFAARTEAEKMGAHLATITSRGECAFVKTFSGNGVWLGGLAPEGKGLDALAYQWITGEPFSFKDWCTDEPNISESHRALAISLYDPEYRWNNDSPESLDESAFIVEWDADCNGDGVVDYGQILNGELLDANSNGVPDCCEDGSICGPSLTVNSSFESGSPLNACALESVSAGNLVASGWQVTAGNVDRIRGGSACASLTQPKFGDYCLDLCGTPASSGAIKQLVPTVPGHQYRCTFWLSGDASAGPAVKKVHAKVGDYIDLSYTFNCSGSGAQAWVMNQFDFTARGANEALTFVADNGVTMGGPMLDSINLVDITTQCVGDLDDSGQVNGADIALLLLNFGDCPVGQ